MVAKLQEEETLIDEAIVSEVIQLTPAWWPSAVLEVSYSTEDGIERYAHTISSLDGFKEPVMPSEGLCAATYDLGRLFRRYGKQWKTVKYEMRLQNNGRWKYTVAFEY